MVDLSTNLGKLKLKNPILTASGTFGSGQEYLDFVDLNELGALVTKSVTLKPKAGNPNPRVCETYGGILNSIGLQNKGVELFIKEDWPFLANLDIPVIINIAGESIQEYKELANIFSKQTKPAALELNISCPNVDRGGYIFGCNAALAAELVSEVRKTTELPIIVKLTPNVNNIVEVANAAVKAGADIVSLINTLLGMAIDVNTFKPKLSRSVGGLSGPAIKPVAIRMIWEVANNIDVPIIGMGGIMSGLDAMEFFLAGASAVSVGTANFINPQSTMLIKKEIEDFLDNKGISSLKEVIGACQAI